MHTEAYNFVKEFAGDKIFEFVVEFGSFDINGAIHHLLDKDFYCGIDLQDGPGVDIVADAAEWDWQEDMVIAPDCVVCCEVLEHAKNWREIVQNAYKNLRPQSWFVVTCATDPRAPHSALDGGPLRPGEYYGNVDELQLEYRLQTAGFEIIEMQTHYGRGDLYVLAQKP